MDPGDSLEQGEYVTVARVLGTQGRRGEVLAELHTGSPAHLAERRRVFVLDAGNRRRELELENFWPHKGLVVLKFRGVDNISQAETLAGSEIQVPCRERLPLPAGEAYVSDLKGCAVFDRGTQIGRVSDVQFGSGDAPLLVVKAGRKEYLLPFAEAYLQRVDVDGKRIDMELPEGMLDLDAPPSEDEKCRRGG